MPAGQLRHAVDVVALVAVDDGQGGSTSAPSTVLAGWPMAVDPSAPAWRIASIVGAQVTDREWVVATCRAHPAVTVGALLTWRGARYHVRGLQDQHGQGRWYVLAADRVLEG